MTAFLLMFLVYAVSPIVASVPEGFQRRDHAVGQETPSARLLVLSVLNDSDGVQIPQFRSAAADDDTEILLKKKRALSSSKVLFEIVLIDAPADVPFASEAYATHADTPIFAYHASLYYFVSGISPPYSA